MKAQAILSLSLVLLGAISASSLTRRSLLPGSQGHSGHSGHSGHHHQPQRRRLGQGRRQPGRGRSRAGARRAARDGDHHEAHPDHENHPDHEAGGHSEARALATGYLPAVEDEYDYDDLAGYNSGSASSRGQSSALPGYSAEPQPGYEADTRDQSQYGEEETTTTESPDYTRDLEDEEASGDSADEGYGAPDGSSADDQYGAPSNVDNRVAAPGEDYGGPGSDVSGVSLARASDTDYAAPGEYDTPSYESGNGFPFAAVENRSGSGAGGQPGDRECPGGSIEECVGVCPGSSIRVYGACVGGCADRCPEN